ncbi:MAG: response regulator [Kiritimatiellae bacterium]|nr:response regulator [Kiritimatiellia bacterium]
MIESDQGSGLRLSLPVSGKEHLKQDSVEASRLVENGRVLVVDDDIETLTMIQSALKQVGYVVEAVPHHNDGLRLLDKGAEGVALVLLDAVMPGKGSAKLMERLSETCPDAAALVMSGFCRDYVQTLLPGKNWAFLQKPFDDGQIIETVNALVRRKFSAQAN